MTLHTRFHALLAAHPDWTPGDCLRAAVNAHRAAHAAELAMADHSDLYENLRAGYLASRALPSSQLRLTWDSDARTD